MNELLEHPWTRRVVASAGVIGAIGVAGWWALLAALTVPYPAAWSFYVAGVVAIVLALRWWRSHPWWTLAVPFAAFALLTVVASIGERLWGWGP